MKLYLYRFKDSDDSKMKAKLKVALPGIQVCCKLSCFRDISLRKRFKAS